MSQSLEGLLREVAAERDALRHERDDWRGLAKARKRENERLRDERDELDVENARLRERAEGLSKQARRLAGKLRDAEAERDKPYRVRVDERVTND